jgi:hypothetical protein
VYNNGDVLAGDPDTYTYYNMYPAESESPCVNPCIAFGSHVQTDRSEHDTLDFAKSKAIYVGQTENPKQFRDHASYIQYKKAIIQLSANVST